MKKFLSALVGCLLLVSAGAARAADVDMNKYVLKAVDNIYASRKDGGYDKHMSYSKSLDYNGKDTIPQAPSTRDAARARATMCVAAVAEVMIEAINLYVAETSDRSPFQSLPPSTWSGTSIHSIRPFLWVAEDTRNVFKYGPLDTPKTLSGKNALSRGTGHALSIFHVGEELSFSDLKPGDFVNLNRANAGGHAVVFLGYIDATNNVTPKYGPGIIGFRYFSAQGMSASAPDHGFGYRMAYFSEKAPAAPGKYADKNVINSTRLLYLSGGRLWVPSRWDVTTALKQIDDRAKASASGAGPTRAANINLALTEEHDGSVVDFDGEEGE